MVSRQNGLNLWYKPLFTSDVDIKLMDCGSILGYNVYGLFGLKLSNGTEQIHF